MTLSVTLLFLWSKVIPICMQPGAIALDKGFQPEFAICLHVLALFQVLLTICGSVLIKCYH